MSLNGKGEKEGAMGAKERPTHETPDGGFGWIVAAAAFLNLFFSVMILQVFSILYAKLFSDNNTSTTAIAWIFNLAQLAWQLATIFLPALCAEFGWRKVSLLAGLLASLSTILSSQVEKAEYLYFTTSFLYGIGGGLGVSIFHIIISQYFDKRRGRVVGIVNCAFPTSQFLAPILVKNLQDGYGAKGATLILGACLLNILVGAMLYHPIEWHWKKVLPVSDSQEQAHEKLEDDLPYEKQSDPVPLARQSRERKISQLSDSSSIMYTSMASIFEFSERNENLNLSTTDENLPKKQQTGGVKIFNKIAKKAFSDISTLRMARAIILTFSTSLNARIFFNTFMLVPFAVIGKGYTMDLAAYCLTVQGITNALSLPIVSSLTDIAPIRTKWYFMIGTSICSASIFIFTLVSGEISLLVALGLYGIGVGTSSCILTQLIIDLMGLKQLPATLGAYGCISLLLCPTVGPSIGFIRDITQDYDFCLRLVSLLHLIPFVLFLLMPLATKFDLKREAESLKI